MLVLWLMLVFLAFWLTSSHNPLGLGSRAVLRAVGVVGALCDPRYGHTVGRVHRHLQPTPSRCIAEHGPASAPDAGGMSAALASRLLPPGTPALAERPQ